MLDFAKESGNVRPPHPAHPSARQSPEPGELRERRCLSYHVMGGRERPGGTQECGLGTCAHYVILAATVFG